MNDKGVFDYVIGFVIMIFIMLILVATILPGLQQVQVLTFSSQQQTFSDINESIQNLPASSAKDSLNTSFNTQYSSAQTQFDIVAFFIQYWWIFIILIISLGTYALARRNVEVQGL